MNAMISKKTVITLAVILLLASCLTAFLVIQKSAKDKQPSISKPDYPVVLPAKKSAPELGDWKRVSPPDSDPVFAYSDMIDDVSISVSQQPLPASFKNNPDSNVAELAKKFNANTKLTAGKISFYLGTSAKGPQSVIFAKDSTLVLIKSQKNIPDTSWVRYIQSLN